MVLTVSASINKKIEHVYDHDDDDDDEHCGKRTTASCAQFLKCSCDGAFHGSSFLVASS